MPPGQTCWCHHRQLTRCQRSPCCCFCLDPRTLANPAGPGSVEQEPSILDAAFCASCQGSFRFKKHRKERVALPASTEHSEYLRSQPPNAPRVDSEFHAAVRTLLAHHARLARLSRRASPSRSGQSRGLAPNPSRIQRQQHRSSHRRDSTTSSSLNNLSFANLPLTQSDMASYPCPAPGQIPQTPPEQVMNNNPEAGPLHDEQNNAPAIPHMNPLRHSSGYGQPLYPYSTGYNAYNSDYGMSGFNTYAGSYGLNPPMHNQGPVPAPSNLSSMNDRMTPPYAPSAMREDSTGYNTGELLSQSLTQRIHETHITAGANQSQPTALNANAALHNDVSREPRGNVSSTTRRHTNSALSGQQPSYSSEVDVIMTPGEILEARRIAAMNDRSERARRRYGTLIQPGNPASPFVRGSPQNTTGDQTRAAQVRAEEDWQLQHYLHQVRAHDRFFALAQNRDIARLEVERAQRVAEASKPKGLDDQNDGRPPPKESKELTVSLECKICMSQLVDTIVLPCGHAVMCRWCARQHMSGNKTSAKCPVCRVNIKVKSRIYIS